MKVSRIVSILATASTVGLVSCVRYVEDDFIDVPFTSDFLTASDSERQTTEESCKVDFATPPEVLENQWDLNFAGTIIIRSTDRCKPGSLAGYCETYVVQVDRRQCLATFFAGEFARSQIADKKGLPKYLSPDREWETKVTLFSGGSDEKGKVLVWIARDGTAVVDQAGDK